MLQAGRVLGVVSVVVSAAAIARAAQAYTSPGLGYDDRQEEDRHALGAALKQNDRGAAARIARRMAARHPEDPMAQYGAGMANAQAGDCEAAIEPLRKLLEPPSPRLPPERLEFIERIRAHVHQTLGLCLDKLGRKDEARAEIAAFCELAESAPDKDELKPSMERLCH